MSEVFDQQFAAEMRGQSSYNRFLMSFYYGFMEQGFGHTDIKPLAEVRRSMHKFFLVAAALAAPAVIALSMYDKAHPTPIKPSAPAAAYKSIFIPD